MVISGLISAKRLPALKEEQKNWLQSWLATRTKQY
jgi:uncharacterized protein YggL (DUF469 family)